MDNDFDGFLPLQRVLLEEEVQILLSILQDVEKYQVKSTTLRQWMTSRLGVAYEKEPEGRGWRVYISKKTGEMVVHQGRNYPTVSWIYFWLDLRSIPPSGKIYGNSFSSDGILNSIREELSQYISGTTN